MKEDQTRKKRPFLIEPGKFHQIRNSLFAEYPVLKRCKPLIIGIHEELQAAHPELSLEIIRAIMRYHTRWSVYLRALARGGMRYNLQGEPIERIKEGHMAFAAKRLEKIEKKRRGRKIHEQAMKAKAAKEKAAQEAAAKVHHEVSKDRRRPVLSLKKKQNAA